jgi:hypothetical protein
VAPSGAKIFPLAEVRRGLHGVAYTVFEGVTPEPMEVEILGVLKDAIGPGQDMILARLHGEKPEYTGVVAGMSGSPVYVDGRLVGAISYRIGQFSKEPICGITPIEQMFEVRDGQAVGGERVAAVGQNGQGQRRNTEILSGAQNDDSRENTGILPAPASKLAGDPVRSAQNDGVEKAVAGGGEVQPIETALVFGGFSQEAVERFGGQFRALGMTPVAGLGGAAEPGTKQPEPLVPGSAVSAILVRGDLSISGTCTVTYVDPTQLLACGHPITQFGRVSMPMTKAEVVATLASPLNAFKIINTTETVGSFTEDRASAILGRFGVAARMIPVSVEVIPETPDKGAEAAVKQVAAQVGGHGAGLPIPQARHATGMKSGMHFEVLDNRELTPAAMQVSVYQSLSGTNSSADDVSYRMDGEFTLKGLPPVHLDGIMAPSDSMTGAMAAAMYVDDQFSRVYSNAVEQPEVTGLRLKMEQIPERRTAVLEGARLGQTEARAGDTLDVEATVPGGGAGGAPEGEAAGQLDARAAADRGERWSDAGSADDPERLAAGVGGTATDGAGRCGGADEPDARQRSDLCDAAEPRRAGGTGGGGAAVAADLDGECAGTAEDDAENAADRGERDGGRINGDGLCGIGSPGADAARSLGSRGVRAG